MAPRMRSEKKYKKNKNKNKKKTKTNKKEAEFTLYIERVLEEEKAIGGIRSRDVVTNTPKASRWFSFRVGVAPP